MTLHDFITLQIQEIDRHKWIESQKAGRDLGEDAVFDWVFRYADDFRRYIIDGLGEQVVYPNGQQAPAMDLDNKYRFDGFQPLTQRA